MRISCITQLRTATLIFLCGLLTSCNLNALNVLSFSVDGKTVGLRISQKGSIQECSNNEIPPPVLKELPAVEKQLKLIDAIVSKIPEKALIEGDRYELEPPLETQDKNLELVITANTPILLCELFQKNEPALSASRIFLFPPIVSRGSAPCTFSIPLLNIATLTGFRISALVPETRFTIQKATIKNSGATFCLEANNLSIPAGARLFESETSTLFDFSYAPRIPEQRVLSLTYKNERTDISISDREIDARISNNVSSQNTYSDFTVRVRNGKNTVYFYETGLDFIPQQLQLSRLAGQAQILELSETKVNSRSSLASIRGNAALRQWKEQDFIAPEPLPADLHALLEYPQKAWRQDFMEVFSWNLFPGILVIDFANLDIQDRFLKRLIYFVEKKGFRGTVQTNEIIDPLHGWNANDFRAESVAAFFNEALRIGFSLNSEEILLRNCLIQWKVIGKNTSGFVPLEGGFLTVARGSGMSAFNRSLLLQHECLHGVFFSRPDFRAQVETAMASMDEEARNFMISYFSFYQYDPADHYLMVNEFQAYLLQQPLANLQNYITQNMVQTFGRYNPDEKRDFRAQAWKLSSTIYRSAKKLSEELYKETGLVNGQLSCLIQR